MAKTATRTASELTELEGQIRHLDGCPAERTESYPARRPNGEEIAVARCIDCGEATYE